VSGKGIAASLLMAICRTNLRQIAPRHDSPAEVLRELNRVMQPDMQPGMFITVLYAVIDVASDTLTFARAGHELPLLVPRVAAGLPPRLVTSEGMAVGLVPDAMFAGAVVDQREPFAAGDMLVLYTDGVTEMRNEEGREFSGARLFDVVRAAAAGSPFEVNERIIGAVRGFAGDEPQRDDFTLVTVRRI
jgi:sigma-B regulation protein RsbU (phosphoserine phosphatase)